MNEDADGDGTIEEEDCDDLNPIKHVLQIWIVTVI